MNKFSDPANAFPETIKRVDERLENASSPGNTMTYDVREKDSEDIQMEATIYFF